MDSHRQQLTFQRDISVARESSWEVWGLNPKLGSPAYSTRTRKGIQITSGCEKQWGFCLTPRNAERLLKGQHRKFHLQPPTLYSGRGRVRWTRDTWGKSGVGGSGERTEGTDARIPVQSHFLYCRGHLSWVEHSSLNGISLRGSNSSSHKNYSAPHCGA